MVLDPIPQSLPVHFFGSRPQPPTSPCDRDRNTRDAPKSSWGDRDRDTQKISWSFKVLGLSAEYAGLFAEDLGLRAATEWRGVIGCLNFTGHFPQKSLIISGSLAKNHLQLKASYGSSQPCTGWQRPIGCLKLQVILRKRVTDYRALLRKMTCNLRHPMGLHHPVLWSLSGLRTR